MTDQTPAPPMPLPGQRVLVLPDEVLGVVDGPPRICVLMPDRSIRYVAPEQLVQCCDHGIRLGHDCPECRRPRPRVDRRFGRRQVSRA